MNNTRLYVSEVRVLPGLDMRARVPRASKRGETIEILKSGDMFVHLFNIDLLALSVMHTYEISVLSNIDTRVVFYEKIDGTLYPLTSSKVGPCRVTKKTLNVKWLALATERPCILQVKLTAQCFDHELSPSFELEETENGLTIVPTASQESVDEIVSNLQSNSLSLPIASLLPTGSKSLQFSGIRYYIELDTAITLTDQVEEAYRYLPFSVKSSSGGSVELVYSIRMKLAAGNSAVVKVSCIESISHNSYSIIKSVTGENLTNEHVGTVATGSFFLPPGTVDVGLAISTPYGFRGNLNDDPDTDLVKFDIFQLVR
ncbi:Hypothetical protein POVR2_LOCUS362 [uncultured virus]|nr:Hypothetical protein POVR2_LOCUS362 [uncultured virus]